MLLEMALLLNRPLIMKNTGEILQPHFLTSLNKFLASMVTFFNTNTEATSPEDTAEIIKNREELIKKRLTTMSIYFIFIDLINREMRDVHYATLDTKDKLKYVFDSYKARFIFSSNERIEKVFADLKPQIEKQQSIR